MLLLTFYIQITDFDFFDCLQKKRFKCPICEKEFMHKKNLVEHMDSHQTDPNAKTQTLTCEICGKSVLKKNWYRHKSIHGEPQHMCPICNKALKDRSSLLRHCRKAHNALPMTDEQRQSSFVA